MAEAVSTFISYSRTDTDFVDRLEADLRARGFKTWVDRRKLEGTREWQPQIDYAITEYPMMIVVLSPDAIASPYVRHEYEYAHQLGKRIVTLLHRPNLPTVPPELSKIQWIDFVDKPYETSLVELIDGCQDPSFNQASDPRILYNQAHDLERPDPERAAILYQRLINRAPNYAGGRVQVDLDRLNQQLHPKRAQRLCDQAETARKEGQYGAEAGALKALIALGGQDRNMLAWAEEYLPIAEQNSAWLDTYENVKHCVEVNDKERARDLLVDLWRKEHAPFFRDPAGVAPALGLKVPMTFEQYTEQRLADEAKAKQERVAVAERDALITQAQSSAKSATDEENGKWQAACDIARSNPRQATSQQVAQLRGWNAASDAAADSFISQGQKMVSTEDQAALADSQAGSAEKARDLIGMMLFNGWFYLAVFLVAAILWSLWSNLFRGGVSVDLLQLFEIIIGLLFVGVAFAALFGVFRRLTARGLRRSIENQQVETTKSAQKWMTAAESEHARRLIAIDNEHQQAMSAAQAQYQQRMDAIASEHARTLADIKVRYAGG